MSDEMVVLQMDKAGPVDAREYRDLLRSADKFTLFLGLAVVALPFYSVLFFDGVNVYQAGLSALVFGVFLMLIRSRH